MLSFWLQFIRTLTFYSISAVIFTMCNHCNYSFQLITIPTKPGSSNPVGNRNFHFGVSSLNVNTSNPLQGIIECIKHPDRKGNKLSSYGPLESKISIAATEDVYENTRNRMAQVDAERKDVRYRSHVTL